jgi:hypothetical protein
VNDAHGNRGESKTGLLHASHGAGTRPRTGLHALPLRQPEGLRVSCLRVIRRSAYNERLWTFHRRLQRNCTDSAESSLPGCS